LHHVPLGSLNSLANCLGHILCLANAGAHFTFPISHHDERIEAARSAALVSFGHGINAHHPLLKLFGFPAAEGPSSSVAPSAITPGHSCHRLIPPLHGFTPSFQRVQAVISTASGR